MTKLTRIAPAVECRVLLVLALALLAILAPLRLGAVEIDDIKITLQSQKYYAKWDMTRFVYRVKSSSVGDAAVWILALASCASSDAVDVGASSSFDWTETPVRGLLFQRARANEKFYIWLNGQWELGPVPVGVGQGADATGFTLSEIDGPSCGSSGISIEVVQGGAIAFPSVSGEGRLVTEDETLLRVNATSVGWALTHSLDFDLPSGASEEIVRRVFEVIVAPYSSNVGTSELTVTYAVEIRDEDLLGLPQGDYGVTIAFTVSTD